MQRLIDSPSLANALAPLQEASPTPVASKESIEAIKSTLDLNNSLSILNFGAKAQQDLQLISQHMLEGVRNKDVGPAGDALSTLVVTLRGFGITTKDGRSRQTWWEKLFGMATPFAKLLARFETVRNQIDTITDSLLAHEMTLMRDVKSLDKLYEKTLAYYQDLGLYIQAGESILHDINTQHLPALEKSLSNAPETDGIMQSQTLRDLRAKRDDLERRVHDLKLTRQVTMQALPSIRMVQENDKSLIGKIASTLNNTIPLWETQLAQALTIQRSKEAATTLRAASDLTNELLTRNAQNLQEANKIVRTEMERGVFDIEAIKSANATLIATIEESLTITQTGKTKRAEAEKELATMEQNLQKALLKAKSHEID